MDTTIAPLQTRQSPPVRRCGCGGVVGPTGECAACRAKRLAREAHARSVGKPINPTVRPAMEKAFGHDFSSVRIHADAASTAALRARAFTTGSRIVTAPVAAGPSPSLLAHELAHVVQQRGASGPALAERASTSAEGEAHAAATAVMRGQSVGGLSSQPLAVARQGLEGEGSPAAMAYAPGGGGSAAGPAMICSKRLEAPGLGRIANHAYIDDTGRGDCRGSGMLGNYAIQQLVSGNFLSGCAVKTDRSTDPQTYTPNVKPCTPKAGVSDVHSCLRNAFLAYSDPSEYNNNPFRSPWGPNSNTFAATLAKSCCGDSSDAGLGRVPGWFHAPAGPCPNDVSLVAQGDTSTVSGSSQEAT